MGDAGPAGIFDGAVKANLKGEETTGDASKQRIIAEGKQMFS